MGLMIRQLPAVIQAVHEPLGVKVLLSLSIIIIIILTDHGIIIVGDMHSYSILSSDNINDNQ